MSLPKWARLREAATASGSPALLRPGASDNDDDDKGGAGDGDADDGVNAGSVTGSQSSVGSSGKGDLKEEGNPFGDKKAPPFGSKDANDDDSDSKDGKGKGGSKKTKESATLEARLEALEASQGTFRSLRESKPASMTAAFSTPTRVKTSDGQEGYKVILIREGRGNSDHDQWYTAESIREMVESGVAEGMQAFGNHPTEEEEEVRPERDVKELVGSYHDVKFAESGGKARADAIFVPLTLNESHPRYGWVVTLAEAATRNTSQQPICGISLFGLSAGEDMDRPDGTQGRMVDMIRPSSGDIVTNAGAGGGFIRQLMESARALRNRSTKELNPMKSMAYQTAVREAAKRVREATSDEDRTSALEALTALEGEKIDNVPDSIEQLREAAPALVEKIRETVTAEVKEADGDLKTENEQLRGQLRETKTALSGLTDAIGITEALREAQVEDPLELRHYAGMAQQRGLTESKDIREMVEVDKALIKQRRDEDIAAMREVLVGDLDSEVEGVYARVPASAMPTDDGAAALTDAGIPMITTDAE